MQSPNALQQSNVKRLRYIGKQFNVLFKHTIVAIVQSPRSVNRIVEEIRITRIDHALNENFFVVVHVRHE